MPPAAAPAGTTSAANAGVVDRWVTVSWFPHTSISQNSHVEFSIRSILGCLDRHHQLFSTQGRGEQEEEEDWQVRITVHGIAGLALVPVSSMTEFAPLTSIKNKNNNNSSTSINAAKTGTTKWKPLVSNTTLSCEWDSMIHIPLRWRDLPRDAYLQFEVTSRDTVVRKNCFLVSILFYLLLMGIIDTNTTFSYTSTCLLSYLIPIFSYM